MPKFFASGRISSLALSSAQSLPNTPVGLPSSLIVTELKLALEWSGAGAGASLLSEEEEISRLSEFSFAVAAGGRKAPVHAGGKVTFDAGGRKVLVDAGGGGRGGGRGGGGGRVAVEFVATALTTLSVG